MANVRNGWKPDIGSGPVALLHPKPLIASAFDLQGFGGWVPFSVKCCLVAAQKGVQHLPQTVIAHSIFECEQGHTRSRTIVYYPDDKLLHMVKAARAYLTFARRALRSL